MICDRCGKPTFITLEVYVSEHDGNYSHYDLCVACWKENIGGDGE